MSSKTRRLPSLALAPITLVLALLILLAPVTAHAARYEVNPRHPQASDANPGSAERPFKTIGRAAQVVQAGDSVVIHDGIYRESVVVSASGTPDKPITFEPAPGAHVVLTGADRIIDWQKEPGDENVFSTPWPHSFMGWTKHNAHPDNDFHLQIGRAEQVFVLGFPYHQVLRREQVGRGDFCVDQAAKRLYVCPRDGRDLTKGFLVEASVRGEIWESRGDNIHLRGLRFRYAANMAQHGAAIFSGKNGLIEDCVFEYANSQGAVFTGEGITARRCVFQENGQLGLGGGHAFGLHLEDCVIRANSTKGWDRGWEAGGVKLCFVRGVVIERCQFLENRGVGLWFDIGCEQNTVRNCLFADNEESGLFYEISYGLHASDNVLIGNGFAEYPGSWGSSCAIALSSSPDCLIERNLMVGNKEGFNFREQDRTTPRIGKKGSEEWVWNHDEVIRNNLLAWNRDAQVWGWFDMADGRHWPAALSEMRPESARAKEDIAALYLAKGKTGAPVGLDLARLNIRFANNLFAAAPGQGLFNWGAEWKKHRKYTSLEAMRGELAIDNGSRQAEPAFADPVSRDFRLPAGSPALQMGCYPQGAVPGVALGVLGK